MVHSPVEDGGLGIYKYEVLHPFLQSQAIENASHFLRSLELQLNSLPPMHSSLLQAWKANTFIANGGAKERDGRTFLKGDGFVSWLEARPTNNFTRLDDEEMEHQINLIMDQVQPIDGVCNEDKTNPVTLKALTARQFSRHIVTCKSCVGGGFLGRHEAVVQAIRATLKFHGINSYIPRAKDLPLPDKEKGGPDLMVSIARDEAVDVTVVSTLHADPGESIRARLQEAYAEKLRGYQEFEALTRYRIVPFVMSHFGLVAKQTRDLIQTWRSYAMEQNFIYDLYNNVQFAVIRAQHRTFQFITNRNRLVTAQKKWEQARTRKTETNIVVQDF